MSGRLASTFDLGPAAAATGRSGQQLDGRQAVLSSPLRLSPLWKSFRPTDTKLFKGAETKERETPETRARRQKPKTSEAQSS